MNKKKIYKVLIALDYNPTAQKVIETGYSFAKSMEAEVTLLHVVTDPMFYASVGYSPVMGMSGYIDVSPIQLESVEGLKQASVQFLDKTKKHIGDNSIKTLVKDGDYADAILSAAKEMHADIIVLGSHSRKWLENILMGSVTEKVLHNTKIPLFIVPTKKMD